MIKPGVDNARDQYSWRVSNEPISTHQDGSDLLGLNDGVRPWVHQRLMTIVEADHIGRASVRSAYFDDLSLPVGLAHDVAVDKEAIAHTRVHQMCPFLPPVSGWRPPAREVRPARSLPAQIARTGDGPMLLGIRRRSTHRTGASRGCSCAGLSFPIAAARAPCTTGREGSLGPVRQRFLGGFAEPEDEDREVDSGFLAVGEGPPPSCPRRSRLAFWSARSGSRLGRRASAGSGGSPGTHTPCPR